MRKGDHGLRSLLDRARYDADQDGLIDALSRAAFRARLDHVAACAGALPALAARPLGGAQKPDAEVTGTLTARSPSLTAARVAVG